MNNHVKNCLHNICNTDIIKGYTKNILAVMPDDWSIVPLAAVLKKQTATNDDNSIRNVLTNSATKGIVSQTDYFDKQIANNDNTDLYYIVKPGYFVYNPRISVTAPCGPFNRYNGVSDGIMSPLYSVYALKNDSGFDTDYLAHYFLSSHWYAYMNSVANYGARSDRMNITSDDMNAMPLPLPPLPEQRKIAAILSTQDKLIELKSSLLDEKLRQKKYLMQVLLTGQKRLNHIKTQWIKCKIMDCGSCVSGNGFPIKYQGELSGTYPFYKVSDFNVLSNHRYMQRANNYITTEVAEILSCNIIPAYSIIFAKIGAAIFLERKRINTTECCIDNNMMAFVPNDKVDPQYICYLFQKMRFGNIVEASALPTINAANLGNIVIHLPSIDEQKAIANILSTADREIELLRRELELEKLKKKSLMQLLLTGKVRVKIDE